MATWESQEPSILTEKKNLDDMTTDAIIRSKFTEMKKSLAGFVNSGGFSTNPDGNPDYVNANGRMNELLTLENQYSTFLKSLSTRVRNVVNSADVTNKLQQVGQIQQSIGNLEKELQDAKQDVHTSLARQDNITHAQQETSLYQGFSSYVGFVRPLRKLSVPILFGFSILILFFIGLMLREYMLPVASQFGSMGGISSSSLWEGFTDGRFLSIMGGIVFVGVIVTILSIYGFFGKNIQ